jgi:hypothetical protein
MLPSKTGLRRTLLALCAFAAVSMALATPALADHRQHRRHYRSHGGHRWHPPLPRIHVAFPLPPVVIVAGPRARDYGYDDRGYDDRRYDRGGRAYERGYEDGYEDGYDDRGREAWRRDRRHRHDRDCDHRYY